MINIVTALHCEAKPIISCFGLKKYKCDGGFDIFSNDSVSLIVTGIGKLLSSAGTAYLHGVMDGKNNSVWINIGIAGHSSCQVGCGLLAHKITDVETGRDWYPVPPKNINFKSANLITFNEPNQNYDKSDSLFDMEAAGFYAAASRFSTAELIQCYKVVSDNGSLSTTNITKKTVENIIANKMPDIELLVSELEKY